jgi:hypothetical protein
MEPVIRDSAPADDGLTDYDRTLLIVYVRMLDAAAVEADWREVSRVLLKIDPEREPDRARRRYDTHLARARWMTEQGYRHLLMEADEAW